MYEIRGYRIVEIRNGRVYSLFHGTNKSREILTDRWYLANVKLVRDGSGQKYYKSGWHFFKTLEAAQHMLEVAFRDKENRKIIPCQARGDIRPKSHSPRSIWLADEIFIASKDI